MKRYPYSTILLLLGVFHSTIAFQVSPSQKTPIAATTPRSSLSTIQLKSQSNNNNNNNNNNNEYTRDVRLREEAESPFRRVRFFLYFSLGGGALTSLFLSLARIAAASSGINPDLLQESVFNAGVDVAGLVVLAVLFQRDLAQQESRLKRATKGASLAKLAIRVNKGP